MNQALRVPDQAGVRFPQYLNDQHDTPEQALDSGDVEACDDFFEYMTSPIQRQELYDFLMSEADSIVIRANIKRWSDKTQRGEM